MLLVALQMLVAWLILSQLKRKIGFLHTLHRTSEQGFSEDKTMHAIDACRGADAVYPISMSLSLYVVCSETTCLLCSLMVILRTYIEYNVDFHYIYCSRNFKKMDLLFYYIT